MLTRDKNDMQHYKTFVPFLIDKPFPTPPLSEAVSWPKCSMQQHRSKTHGQLDDPFYNNTSHRHITSVPCTANVVSCFTAGCCHHSTTITIQQEFTRDNPGQLVPELSETLTQFATLIVLKFLTSTPNLPSQSSSSV